MAAAAAPAASTHRPVVGPVVLFAKRRVLLPMMRWLFEYSQENFRRQQRLNRIVFACLEELAIENARLRQRMLTCRARPGSDPVRLACVVHRYGAEIAGGSERTAGRSPSTWRRAMTSPC